MDLLIHATNYRMRSEAPLAVRMHSGNLDK